MRPDRRPAFAFQDQSLAIFAPYPVEGMKRTIRPALRTPPCTDHGCWPNAPSGNWRAAFPLRQSDKKQERQKDKGTLATGDKADKPGDIVSNGRYAVRITGFAAALAGVATVAHAQDAIQDLKGTWEGKGQSIVFGANQHHPGSQTVNDPPRVRDFDFTCVVEGQDGHLAGVTLTQASPLPMSPSPGPYPATTRPSSGPTTTAISR